ncbi:MAG: hypothetical protein ACI88A_004244, partial [Paraglaciecola sp.]
MDKRMTNQDFLCESGKTEKKDKKIDQNISDLILHNCIFTRLVAKQ